MEFDNIQSNFTAGEVSPKLWGRVELEKYLTGLAIVENMIVQPYGGIIRRGGFHYITEVKDSSKITRIVEFNYKNIYAYILEFGENYIRVYVNREQVAGPYEIVTTYIESEILNLRFEQDTDTLYITHKDHPPAKLTRTAHNNWVLVDIDFEFDYEYKHEWVSRVSAVDNNWIAICWSPELKLFAAVSIDGTGNRVMTSPDGITWTIRTSAADNDWQSICWSPELTLFAAVANTGTGNRVMTSPDGVTWTIRTSAVDNNWYSVCWSPELTLFVAVAGTGTADRVMTSPDGVTWTTRTSAADNIWLSVCWSPELTLFVAVAEDGASNRVMTSPDGLTWTIRTSAANLNWRAVCWSPELTLFVVVAKSGVGNRVMTSPDGITWTVRTSAADNEWYAICWSPELTLFVAVSYTGTGDKIMTSPDGITWTIRTSAINNFWRGVCWSPELELFAAVSSSGTADRVMTSGLTSKEWTAGDYPSLNWFFEQRHFFAATPSKLNGIWASQSANYTDMRLGTGLDNEGLEFIVKMVYEFLWASAGQEINLGGSNAEFKLASNALNEAITPSNIRPTLSTNYGSIFISPVRIDDSVVFVQKGGRKFRRFVADYQSGSYSDSYKASDITILSSHIATSGVLNLVYSTVPDSIIWACRTDGILIGLTYEPDHKVFGWHRHIVGGTDVKVKSLAVAKAVEGVTQDELWAIIERTIDGSTVQYIEYMIEGLPEEEDIEDAFFVDSGITKTGSALTLVDGLDHLEGEEVQILGNGAAQAPKTVSGGEITLDQAVDKVHVGLQYISNIETLPIEGGNPLGTSQGHLKRIKNVSLRLDRSIGFSLGDVYGDLDQYYFGPSVMDDPIDLFTGDTEPVPFTGGYDRQSRLKIMQDAPLPFNLLAIMYSAKMK